MHMRLPSLRACRYIAERRAIPDFRTGLAAAAYRNVPSIRTEWQTGYLSLHPVVQLVVIIFILLGLATTQLIHSSLLIVLIILIRQKCRAE